MQDDPRISKQAVTVLSHMLETPGEARHGFELMTKTGVSSGTLYPLLRRLADAGWLTVSVEQINPVFEGRPPRKFYALTPLGESRARSILDERDIRPPAKISNGSVRLA